MTDSLQGIRDMAQRASLLSTELGNVESQLMRLSDEEKRAAICSLIKPYTEAIHRRIEESLVEIWSVGPSVRDLIDLASLD